MRRILLGLIALALCPKLTFAQSTNQVVEYYHTDALGSVRAVTKQVSGQWQVVARHDFMPFGEEVSPQNPPVGRRLFTGKERDHETGLDYFEARYLRSSLGVFSSIDPVWTTDQNLADPQRWGRYSYARQNPIRWRDPDGRQIKMVAPTPLQESSAESNQSARDKLRDALLTWAAPMLNPSERVALARVLDFALGNTLLPASPQERATALQFNCDASQAIVATGITRGAIGSTGRIGEQLLPKLGGESNKFFRTDYGARFVDQFIEGEIHESKVGYTSLTRTVAAQVEKDVFLSKDGLQPIWHFFPSPVTGKGGPSGPLRQLLINSNIIVK